MFNNKIRQRREELGLSQSKLARLVGVAESAMSDLELGKRQPWPKVRSALAEVLEMPQSELFEEGNTDGR